MVGAILEKKILRKVINIDLNSNFVFHSLVAIWPLEGVRAHFKFILATYFENVSFSFLVIDFWIFF